MAPDNSERTGVDRFKYCLKTPHPFSQMHTQLVWEGKYDEFGNRREIDLSRSILPLQKIETIDEPRSRAEAAKDQKVLFQLEQQARKLGDFRNYLIWGDNKLVMASLLADFKGSMDLIYIDPPFDVGADFTMDIPMGEGKETIEKDQSALEFVAFKDMWGKGTDSYLHMMFERLVLMRDLLKQRGTLVLHCDYHMGHYLKLLLDEIFGRENLINEIVWHYVKYQMRAMGRYTANSDRLLWYAKTQDDFTFNLQTIPLEQPRRLLALLTSSQLH